MSLTNFRQAYDNSYEEIFQKRLVAKPIMNTRFQGDLRFGQSVTRFTYDISQVRVRTVTRGAASTIDPITDGNEALNINLEKETAFHISDGERTQAGPLNPGEVIGAQIATKLQIDLDARCFAETLNAAVKFDQGNLTTGANNGTPITLTNTTVPQLVARAPAVLKGRNNQDAMSNMVMVIDNLGASDIAQYLMGKNIDLAGNVFQNGYSGSIANAQMYVSENLTGTVVGTTTGNFSAGETVTLNGVTFTFVSTIGATPGNVLIGAGAQQSLANLVSLINNPGVTTANGVALATADQLSFTDVFKAYATSTATTITINFVGGGRPTSAETGAAFSVVQYLNVYFGKKGAIDLVIQDQSEVDMRTTADRRGTNVFSSYLAGIKTFKDGSYKFLDVLIAA